jgi:uncharacterized protein (TIGR02597 family)
MKTNHSFLALAIAGSFLLAKPANAQSTATEPVGFKTSNPLGNSDSFVALPFIRPPVFLGGIQSVAGNTITVAGSPWTANQFVYAAGIQPNHYYVLVGPANSANPKEGHTYPVISNGTNTLAVELGPDNLAGVPANAQISVIPNWTLATVFPPTDQNVSFTPTTSTAQYKTQIRVPDVSAPGIDLPYVTYFFSNNVNGSSANVGWRLVGDNTTDHGDDALLPDSYFVVRHQNGSPTLPLISLGGVLLKKFTVPLMTAIGSAQDNPVSMLRPLNVALNATGLNATDGSFVPGDQLRVFNNAQVGFNKAPSAIYVQNAAVPHGPWRLVSGNPVNDRGADVIPAGTGFIIRKAATADAAPDYWTNSFPVRAISAVSRKTHGASGNFDLALPLTGTPGVECRAASTSYKIVFTFPSPVTLSGATLTSGTASTVTPLASGANEVTVDLTGVNDGQWFTVTLLDVNDGANTNDVAVRMGILPGDTTGNGAVNASDISQVKLQSGQLVTATNFRQDLTCTGSINASDVSLAKSKSGTGLPSQ